MNDPNVSLENLNHGGIVSYSAYLRSIGRSDMTGLRMRERGWITAFDIAGRPYVTREEIARFEARAKAGEFSKPLTGAAAKARTQKQEALAGKAVAA